MKQHCRSQLVGSPVQLGERCQVSTAWRGLFAKINIAIYQNYWLTEILKIVFLLSSNTDLDIMSGYGDDMGTTVNIAQRIMNICWNTRRTN